MKGDTIGRRAHPIWERKGPLRARIVFFVCVGIHILLWFHADVKGRVGDYSGFSGMSQKRMSGVCCSIFCVCVPKFRTRL